MSKTSFKDIVKDVAAQSGFAQRHVRIVFDYLFTTISMADAVTIPGFGTFKKKDRPAREYLNPQNGEKVTVPARTVLTFKESKRK